MIGRLFVNHIVRGSSPGHHGTNVLCKDSTLKLREFLKAHYHMMG